jgi:hypothetical protein
MADQPSLTGPLARIDRADELTHQLEASCKAFLATRPYTVEQRPDDNPAVRAFVVTSLHDVPVLPRIISGEIAHHLRASLDLLAYQLLLKANITNSKRLRDCTFPIIVDRDLTKPEDRKKHDASISQKIDGIDRRSYDRIVALQPCATNREWSHLAQVQALDNVDKHRLLLAATSSIRIGGWSFRDEHGNITTMPHRSFIPLQVDAMLKVGDAPTDFVLPNLAQEVAFLEPGPVFGKPLAHILQNLSRMTRHTVESFADCF